MTNEIPKEAKEKLLKRIKDTFSSKNPEKFLLIFISESKKGTSTGFLSGYNDMETLGHIEKIKLFTYNRIAIEEMENSKVTRVENYEKPCQIKKLTYVN